MDESHTYDIRNIEEGDEVIIETSEGHRLDMTCEKYEYHHGQNPDLVREAHIWHFDLGGDEVTMVRHEGLRESSDMKPFPHDKVIWNFGEDVGCGYAESVNIRSTAEA